MKNFKLSKVFYTRNYSLVTPHSCTKEDLYIEAQKRCKNFALIIKSSLFEGIFLDAKGVKCASLETVRAKKYFL